MNLELTGKWNELKGKLKQQYGEMMDDDSVFADGKEEELLGFLQKKLGKSRDTVEKEVEQLLK